MFYFTRGNLFGNLLHPFELKWKIFVAEQHIDHYSMLLNYLLTKAKWSKITDSWTSLQVWPIAGAKNLKHFTPSMKKRVNFVNRSRPRMCGRLSLTHRLKRVHHTCSTKMLVTENPINKILAPSSAPIFAQKSLNTAAQTRYVGSNYTC